MSGDSSQAPLKLVIVGEVEVGKTSICGRLVEEYTRDQQATIMPCFHKYQLDIDGKQLNFNIWDTAGAERYRSVNRSFYHNTKAAVLVYDISNRRTWDELQNYWVEEVQNEGHDDMVIAIVGNKCDLETANKRAVSQEVVEKYCKQNGFIFRETSATKNINVRDVFRAIGKKCLQEERLFENKSSKASVKPGIKATPASGSDNSNGGCAC